MGSLVRVGECRGFDTLVAQQLCLLCGEEYIEADRFQRNGQLIIIFECKCDRENTERIRAATEIRQSNRGKV